MRLFLLLLLASTTTASSEYQTIPLRHKAALDHIHRLQQTNFADLLDDASTFESPVRHLTLFSADNTTTQCLQDVHRLLEAVEQKQLWAIKVIDAWGKPLPSGILKGNTFWIGNYDECVGELYQMSTKSYLEQPISTQYCTISPSPSSLSNTSSSLSIVLGICVPSSCDRSSIVQMINSVFTSRTLTETNVVCSNDPPNGQDGLTLGAILTIAVISLLGMIVLLGTAVDLLIVSRRTRDEKAFEQINSMNNLMNIPLIESGAGDPDVWFSFVAEFSAIRSLRRIFTMKERSSQENYPFINGIRVLSLFWVIIGHTFLFALTFSSNAIDALSWTRNVSMQLISNATFSVDTFFFLSGFLTAILFVRHAKREEKLSFRFVFLYYIHRYIRLTPAFLLVIFVSIHLTPYFGNGPVYPSQQGFEVQQCRSEYWWTSIVYVGNLVKPDYMCLPIAWYLHNDMQFHWIAPLALIPFALGRKAIGFLVAIIFVLVGIGSIVGLTIYYPSLQTSGLIDLTPPTGPTFFDTVYITPWCRVSAYFVGVWTAFLVINVGSSSRLAAWKLFIGHIVAVLLALACLFAFYPDSILPSGVDRVSFIVYQSLSRTLWCVAIGWLFYVCITKQGGIVNRILSWSIWAPLARLNYSTYLIHLTVIYITINNQRTPFYYQPHLVVNLFFTQVFFSYVAGILVSIFFETPFFILEKKLFKR